MFRELIKNININNKLKTLISYLFNMSTNNLNVEKDTPLNKAPYRGAFLGAMFLRYKYSIKRIKTS